MTEAGIGGVVGLLLRVEYIIPRKDRQSAKEPGHSLTKDF
jgi:hypothetical protein